MKKICTDCGMGIGLFSFSREIYGKTLCDSCLRSRYGTSHPIPDEMIDRKTIVTSVETNGNEFKISEKKFDMHIHIFFRILEERHFMVCNSNFVGIEPCSGRLFYVKHEHHSGGDDPEDNVAITSISYEYFNEIVNKYPLNIRKTFEGISKSNWRDYLDITAMQIEGTQFMSYIYRNNVVELTYFHIPINPFLSCFVARVQCNTLDFEKWFEGKTALECLCTLNFWNETNCKMETKKIKKKNCIKFLTDLFENESVEKANQNKKARFLCSTNLSFSIIEGNISRKQTDMLFKHL